MMHRCFRSILMRPRHQSRLRAPPLLRLTDTLAVGWAASPLHHVCQVSCLRASTAGGGGQQTARSPQPLVRLEATAHSSPSQLGRAVKGGSIQFSGSVRKAYLPPGRQASAGWIRGPSPPFPHHHPSWPSCSLEPPS